MKQKLNCILLIDDDEATNFLHKIVIRKLNCTENIVSIQSAKLALEYLKSEEDNEHPKPDLIFLDINMPAMNGWEFLEEYKKLDESKKGGILIVMLTSSLNPDDKEKSKKYKEINKFLGKPLTPDTLTEIFEKYFPERF